MKRNKLGRDETGDKIGGKKNSEPPPFSLYGKITGVYLISTFLFLTTNTVLDPHVRYSEAGYPPSSYIVYQVLFAIAVAVLYYRVTKKARNGSTRASLITSGFLFYFAYSSLYSFYLFYSHLSIKLLLPIILTGALFVLSVLDLYDYYVPRDAVNIKSYFPGKREHLAPGWFLLLLIPLICLMSVVDSLVRSVFYDKSFLYILGSRFEDLLDPE